MESKLPLSAPALDSLMSALEVNFLKLLECLVSRGWGLSLSGRNAVPGIHYCLAGTGRLIVGEEAPVPFTAHTLVVTPPGTPFRIEALEEKDPSGLIGTVESRFFQAPPGELLRLVAGDREPEVVMICGYFRASYGAPVELFAELTAPIVESFTAADQLDHKLKAALEELLRQEIGSGAMSTALLKQVLITLLRRSLSSTDRWTARFLAMSDPKVARAFSDMVARPGAPHSVRTLAATAGLSRSAFMSRFATAFGDSPMTVLRHLRMRRARVLLATQTFTTERIAAAVGYSNRSSFHRAFVKTYGKAPTD